VSRAFHLMCLTVCEYNSTTACYSDGQSVITAYGYSEVCNSQFCW